MICTKKVHFRFKASKSALPQEKEANERFQHTRENRVRDEVRYNAWVNGVNLKLEPFDNPKSE